MSKITLDNLSDNLKAYLEGLGLSEEQVLNLINENGLNEEELKAMLKDTMSINELNTNSKTVIGAINELFQSANNGKELIANAIGEPLSSNDTFSAMSNNINGLLSQFKINMMNNGIAVESGDKFKALIDKIATLADNEGKVIQYLEGTTDINLTTVKNEWVSKTINFNDIGLTFNPTYLFIRPTSFNVNNGEITTILCNVYNNSENNVGFLMMRDNTIINGYCYMTSSSESFTFFAYRTIGWTSDDEVSGIIPGIQYYAIGVGEEDTTLRDSLASILQEEGVIVTEEDDMASLISKVDEEFDRQVAPAGTAVASNVDKGKTFINSTGQLVTGTSTKVSPAGTAVASNVLSGKTFINSTGSTVTGTMADRGGAQTVTPGTSNKTLNSGYYSGNITVKGDSNLKAENIVSGKSIFGVSGTAQSLTICEGTDFTLHIWEPTSSGPYTTSDDYASYSEHEEGYDLKTVNHTGTYTCTATVNPGMYTTGYFEFVVYDSSGKVIKRSSEFEAVNSGSTNLGGRTTKSAALSATAGQKIAVRYRTEGQYEIRLWSFKIQFSLG